MKINKWEFTRFSIPETYWEKISWLKNGKNIPDVEYICILEQICDDDAFYWR